MAALQAAAHVSDPAALEALVEDAVVWASQHGLVSVFLISMRAWIISPACTVPLQ